MRMLFVKSILQCTEGLDTHCCGAENAAGMRLLTLQSMVSERRSLPRLWRRSNIVAREKPLFRGEQAKTISDMPDKKNKKKAIKELKKEIGKLRDEYEKIEVRPCQGDTDLRQRENELEILKSKISELEKERDTYLYSWSH